MKVFCCPPFAEASRKATSSLKEWIAANNTTEIASEFLFRLHRYIFKAVCYISSSSKKLNAGGEKMWSTYYKTRISPTFRRTWCVFFMQAIGSIPPSHPYQHITDLILSKMVQRHVDGIAKKKKKEQSQSPVLRGMCLTICSWICVQAFC